MEGAFAERFAKLDPWKLTLWTFVLSVGMAAPGLLVVSNFSFDSWSTYELAPRAGRAFFAANTVRAYTLADNGFSAAFPPLWPIVVAVFDEVIGNVYGSYVAAFACFILFAIAAERFGRSAFERRGLGLLSALLLLRFTGLRGELGAGRSIPLFLLEIACTGSLLLGLKHARPRRFLAIGALAGAMAMTRFDALPAAAVLLGGVVLAGVHDRRLLFMLAAFAVVIAPWVVYSEMHFQRLFATDNSAVALSLDPQAFVLDYQVGPARTARDAPGAWIAKVLGHGLPFFAALGNAVVASIFAPVVAVAAALAGMRPTRARDDTRNRRDGLLLFAAVTAAPLLGYLISGYLEQRYFTAVVWLSVFMGLGFLSGQAPWFAALNFVLVTGGGLANVSLLRHTIGGDPAAHVRAELDRTEVDAIVACLRRTGADRTDGILFRDGTPSAVARFGALSGWRTLSLPSNWTRLDVVGQQSFLRKYEARFVAGRVPTGESMLEGGAMIPCTIPLRRIDVPTPRK